MKKDFFYYLRRLIFNERHKHIGGNDSADVYEIENKFYIFSPFTYIILLACFLFEMVVGLIEKLTEIWNDNRNIFEWNKTERCRVNKTDRNIEQKTVQKPFISSPKRRKKELG